MLRLMAEGTDPLRVVDDQVGCPTYTPYLARALWDLAEIGPAGGAAGVVHYRNREPVSWYGFACEIAASRRPAVAVEPISTAESARPAPRPAYSVLASSFEGASSASPAGRSRAGAPASVTTWTPSEE
jgi:dTDP-4-dehydrorhamnose reductase